MKPENEQPVTAPEWMVQIAGGELTRAEKVALTDWLRDSPRHVREFLELELLREDLKTVRLSKQLLDQWVREARETSAIAISSATSRMSSSAIVEKRESTFRGLRIHPWALAASIVLSLATFGGFQWWNQGRYVTGFGEQRTIALADGSVVTLNTSSELRVNLSRDRRALKLVKGEAFFRVAHEALRPFEVMADNAAVKAVGTRFNVRLVPTATVVSVLDGVVEVRDHIFKRERENGNAIAALRLTRGEEARVNRAGTVVPHQPASIVKSERAVVARAAAWTKGRIEFEGAPLIEVLGEFQRYREFSVEIAEPLRALKLTGSFDAQDPESALAYVATLPGVVVENPSEGRFVVRKE